MPKENVSQARDLRIRMIQKRLKHSATADTRKELEGILTELKSEVKPVAKRTLRPEEAPVEAKPTPTPMEPLPKLTVKIWTPDGEIEVVREEPGYVVPNKAPPTGTGRTTTDVAEHDKGPSAQPLAERLKTADRTETEPPPVLGVRVGAEDGGRKPTREEERLMLLTGIKDLDALNRFLNAPDLPPEVTKSEPPYEEYQPEQDLDEENVKLMRNVLAGSAPGRIAPAVGPAFRRYGPILACVLALLLAAFSRWPYAFYVLLRLGVCTVSLYWAVETFKRQQFAWTWALGANVLLFNPLLPIHMASEQWKIVDLLDAIFLASFTCISFYRDRRTDRSTLSGDSRS